MCVLSVYTPVWSNYISYVFANFAHFCSLPALDKRENGQARCKHTKTHSQQKCSQICFNLHTLVCSKINRKHVCESVSPRRTPCNLNFMARHKSTMAHHHLQSPTPAIIQSGAHALTPRHARTQAHPATTACPGISPRTRVGAKA